MRTKCLCAFTVLVVTACSACGDDERRASSDGSSSSGGGATSTGPVGPGPATVTSTSSGESSGTCYGGVQTPERPDLIPEGWTPWTCWGPPGRDCVLWSPPDPGEVEPPLWIPCDEEFLGELACEQMVIAWAESEDDEVQDPFLSEFDGRPLLGFVRRRVDAGGSPSSWSEYVTAEADGRVHAAARRIVPEGYRCTAQLDGAAGERGIITMTLAANEDDGAVLLDPQGVHLGFRDEGSGLNNWSLSAQHAIRRTYSSLIRHDLAFGEPETIFAAPDVGLGLTGPVLNVGDDLLFTAGDYGAVAVFGWRPGAGLVAFEHFPGDVTRGAMGIGGDGTHLVWTRGENRPDVEPLQPIYPDHSVMVSPYTFEPSKVLPRRLRSDPAPTPTEGSGTRGASDAASLHVGQS